VPAASTPDTQGGGEPKKARLDVLHLLPALRGRAFGRRARERGRLALQVGARGRQLALRRLVQRRALHVRVLCHRRAQLAQLPAAHRTPIFISFLNRQPP
jgi:hypothetical protein